MNYRIFYEPRRDVFRVKELRPESPRNFLFPWLGTRPAEWVWVKKTSYHEYYSSFGPREFCSRKRAEEWIADQSPDKWEEIE